MSQGSCVAVLRSVWLTVAHRSSQCIAALESSRMANSIMDLLQRAFHYFLHVIRAALQGNVAHGLVKGTHAVGQQSPSFPCYRAIL